MDVELLAFLFSLLQHRITGPSDIRFDGIEESVEGGGIIIGGVLLFLRETNCFKALDVVGSFFEVA